MNTNGTFRQVVVFVGVREIPSESSCEEALPPAKVRRISTLVCFCMNTNGAFREVIFVGFRENPARG
jgi:hypothetical protein